MPRIPPLSEPEWPESLRDVLAQSPAGLTGRLGENNVFTTLAQHEGLFRAWIRLGGFLLSAGAALDPRTRELLILRSARNCGSSYEWGQHVRIAQALGISREEIERVAEGPGASGLAPADAALLRAADELHEHAKISDGTWRELSGAHDRRAMLEIAMLVGHYTMLAYALNSCEVELDEGLEPLPGGLAHAPASAS